MQNHENHRIELKFDGQEKLLHIRKNMQTPGAYVTMS
jgi:hypothetical protein